MKGILAVKDQNTNPTTEKKKKKKRKKKGIRNPLQEEEVDELATEHLAWGEELTGATTPDLAPTLTITLQP